MSNEWASCEIKSYSATKEKKQTSLRKKMYDKNETSGHKAAESISMESRHILKQCFHEKEIIANIFWTVHIRLFYQNQ